MHVKPRVAAGGRNGARFVHVTRRDVTIAVCTAVVIFALQAIIPRPRLRPPFPDVPSAECVSGVTSVPKVVHLKVRDNASTTHALRQELHQMRGHGWRVDVYTDDTARAYVATHCPSAMLAYDCVVPGAYKADIFRACAMNTTGGVYIDDDLAPLLPLPSVLTPDCEKAQLYAEYEHDKVRLKSMHHRFHFRHLNGILIGPPGIALWRCVLSTIEDNVRRHFYGDDAVDVSGPGVLRKCVPVAGGAKILGFFQPGVGFVGREPPHKIHFAEVNGHIKTKINGVHYSELWSDRSVYACPPG